MRLFSGTLQYVLLLGLTCIIIGLFFVRFRLKIVYGDRREKGSIGVALSVGGLPYITVSIPIPRPVSRDGITKQQMIGFPKVVKHFMRDRAIFTARRFLSVDPPVLFRTIERLRVKSIIGTGDAASTAIMMGVVWGVKSALVSLLIERIAFIHRPQLEVIPDFDKPCLDFHVDCIFRFTIGEIIHAAWPRLFYVFRRKGGDVTNAK